MYILRFASHGNMKYLFAFVTIKQQLIKSDGKECRRMYPPGA